MKRCRVLQIFFFLAVTAVLSGCSVSYSTGKSSDTVSTLLDSVSGSSTSMSGGGDVASIMQGYADDIAAVTYLWVSEKKSEEQFLRLLTAVARTHGIVDWEQTSATFEAMGRGLYQAGIPREGIVKLPFFRKLADNARYALVLQGYTQV